jgi:hypothetical protein
MTIVPHGAGVEECVSVGRPRPSALEITIRLSNCTGRRKIGMDAVTARMTRAKEERTNGRSEGWLRKVGVDYYVVKNE